MWLTLEEVKQRFKVKDSRTILKFIKNGLKCIKVGNQYRFDLKDIEEFETNLKEQQSENLIEIYPIKRKRKSHTTNFDFEKRKKNLKELKVI